MLLNIPAHPELRKIVVLNPKGGSGKTTLATNLAAWFAAQGRRTALMDFDPQGSTMRWAHNRPQERPFIYTVDACADNPRVTRSFQLRIPPEVRQLVVDTPAALLPQRLSQFTRGAHAILVPVLPSDMDIHAVSQLMADLLLVAKVSRRMGRLGVIANRVRENTLAYRRLMRFLESLNIPVVARLRDSQNYVHAAEQGLGIHELPTSATAKDLEGWAPFTDWLEQRLATPLTPRDLMSPLQAVPGGVLVRPAGAPAAPAASPGPLALTPARRSDPPAGRS
ncbi:MAG: ParA family protein [Gammaproteobacteria bacterium]|nr:ParA family protein [Gammaproteobacteria bacterium]